MTALLLLAAAVAWWAWRSGQLRALRFGDVAAAVAALCGVRLLGRGEAPVGIAVIAAAAGWAWLRARSAPPLPDASSVEEARGLLELPADAGRAEIERAYRRVIARVHPDAGGSNELARRVTGARDALLADLERRPSPRRPLA